MRFTPQTEYKQDFGYHTTNIYIIAIKPKKKEIILRLIIIF